MSSPAGLEHAALVALLRRTTMDPGARWSDTTESVLSRGSAVDAWNEQVGSALFDLPTGNAAAELADARTALELWDSRGWRFISIIDEDYPHRLRDIHQAPPFLMAEGELRAEDPAVAVVGSRKATAYSERLAADIANGLVRQNITVLSGLAEGVDAAAHRAALQAGGRTVAVIGTGLDKRYPAKNAELQRAVASKGLVLSQFWPDAPPQRHNFLMRNAVMSGYGRCTVVVQAAETSGARAQARMAVEHGRPVVLLSQVVEANEWARHLRSRPGVFEASSADEVLDQVQAALTQDQQATDLVQRLVLSGA